MTFFGGVGGGRGDDCCGGDASAAAAAAAPESMSSASTRSGCKYLRRNSETRANSSVDSSSLTSLFTCGDGGDLERLAKGERERSRDGRRRRRGFSSSSASSSEQGLLLLLPMMLSMVNPELFALPPPVTGDRRLTTGRLTAVTGAVGLGDRSPADRNGGKRGESLVGGCGGGGGGGIGGRVGKPDGGGNGGPGGDADGGKSGGAPSRGGGAGGG